MPGENLTRSEARTRADLLAVESYAVSLYLTGDDATFVSRSVISFTAESGSATFVDLIAPAVKSITLNGAQLDPDEVFDGARINLTGLAATNELVVTAHCAYMNTGEGLHRFVDPVDKAVYLYTQFEVIDARRMFACFDQPDLKATFAFDITAPADWEVISNSPTPTPEATEPGSARWQFDPTPRMSTYITALIAGPYAGVRSEYRGIPMGVFCRRTLVEHLDADEILDTTRRGFDYFEELFDQPYPFAKYDQVFVPEFNAGAMENAGAVTFLEDYVFRSKVTDAAYERRSETILHELAHMWFGDLVTMRWWDDLWLNESFATFAAVMCQSEATRWKHSWTTFTNLEKTWAYRQDQLPSTHPIAADINDIEDVEVNFDGITYAKGASVLRQLVAWVGHDEFFQGIRAYFKQHAWQNTSLSDLLSHLETSSGRELSHWAKEWLETAGVNTVRPVFEIDAQDRFSSFSIVQSAPEAHPTLRSHRMAVGLYNRGSSGRLERTHRFELDVVGATTDVKDLIGQPQPDLVLLNDDDLAYTKLRLDPHSSETLVESIGAFQDSLPRALCWAAAWDMTRDAEMPARDYVELTSGGIGAETDIGMVQSLIRQTNSALYLFSSDDNREPGLQRFADRLLELARNAAPGGDHQLAFTRAFVGIARGDAQLSIVSELLSGATTFSGLVVDTDLRWSLLQRLAAGGRADEDAIDRELDLDNTASGQRQAAMARAMLPTVAAKEIAWGSLVDSADLPNALLSATVAGFHQPDQLEISRAFIDRYFAMLGSIWRERTNETAQTLVVGLYPTFLVEPETVARTEQFLAEQDPPPALARLLREAADGVRRSLRARAADTGTP